MIKVEINNKLSNKSNIDEGNIDIEEKTNAEDNNIVDEELFDLFQKIAESAAEMEDRESGEISVALVNNTEIQELNKKYRGFDKPTDVLSFPIDEDLWGDIIISIERAVEQAHDFGHSLKREICYLFAHGVFHLLGYDHKTSEDKLKMREKEEKILIKLNILRE